MNNTRRLAPAFLAGWGLLLSVVMALLMARHWVPLSRPAAGDAEWREQYAAPISDPDRENWLAVHVVAEGCACSERILDHLRTRGPLPGVRDRIVRIAETPPVNAKSVPGFVEEWVTADEATARYGAESVPLLLVFSPEGTPKYAGGHTPRKQAYDVRDGVILSDLMAGKPVAELPVYGCPISARLSALRLP